MPKIIDCFMLWNETEVLFIRLDLLYDYVDHFIICESMISHSGKIIKDEYNFIKNKHLYEKYLDKIIFIPLSKDTFIGTGDTAKGFWHNENFQRKSLFNEIQKFPDETLVAISDVDEIWDPTNLDTIQDNVNKFDICGVTQDLFYYYLNCKKSQKWNGTYFIRKNNLTFNKIQHLRNTRNYYKSYVNGGWHFSWMGNVEKIKEKFKCIAEHNIISQYSSEENINSAITQIKDLFGRNGYLGETEIIAIDSQFLPKNIKKYTEKFPYLYYSSSHD